MVYKGKSYLNEWFGGTPIYGNPICISGVYRYLDISHDLSTCWSIGIYRPTRLRMMPSFFPETLAVEGSYKQRRPSNDLSMTTTMVVVSFEQLENRTTIWFLGEIMKLSPNSFLLEHVYKVNSMYRKPPKTELVNFYILPHSFQNFWIQRNLHNFWVLSTSFWGFRRLLSHLPLLCQAAWRPTMVLFSSRPSAKILPQGMGSTMEKRFI